MKLAPALVLLLFGACTPAAGENPDARLVQEIDSLAQLMLSVDPTPGLSIAVVRGADTVVMKGYGLADVERNAAATDQTIFAIGSVTKQFTAAAVMRLVEEGRLRLDATVGEVLPGYAGPGRAVTIHQLLNHTSGIPNYTRSGSEYWNLVDQELAYEQILALFAAHPLEFEPGSRFVYNNSGYYLLGRVIEQVSGGPYTDYLAHALFRPAGLQQTDACSEKDQGANRAQAYGGTARRPIVDRSGRFANVVGTGALCSTARDLVLWARALSGGRVVSHASYERMTSPTPTDSTQARYGYGLGVGEVDGHAFVAHGGGFHGFRAALAHYPNADLTIAVLANGPLPVEYLERRIAGIILGIEPARYGE